MSPSRHFHDPEYLGELPDAHGSGQAGDPGCGAVVRIFLRFEGEDIGAARFLASGSSAAIAAGDALAWRITGASWKEAAALGPEWLEEKLHLEGVGNSRTIPVAAGFAIEALHRALEDALHRGMFPQAEAVDEETILVAMSGGVDSAAACLLERRSGRDVIGVTMRLWSDPECAGGSSNTCCSPEAILEARAVCHRLGAPHLTVDYSQAFKAAVVDDFIDAYLAGETPNPCVRCNARFRFDELLKLADRLGAARVATGHYANVTNNNGTQLIARGADAVKDQSYMLWGVKQAQLARIHFPLGVFDKKRTRQIVSQARLSVHDRPESQEICFIPDADYRRFIRAQLEQRQPGAQLPGEGDIVSPEGRLLGRHSGYLDYTIGQRRGLGVSAPEPLYVLAVDAGANRVIAGPREALAVTRLALRDARLLVPAEAITAPMIQVRYNSDPVPGKIIMINERPGRDAGEEESVLTIELELGRPAYGVAPGQSAVIYQDGIVAGGGIIAS